MKRYSVWLCPVMVEALQDLARRQAAERRINMSWVDLLRDEIKKLLAAEAVRNPKEIV